MVGVFMGTILSRKLKSVTFLIVDQVTCILTVLAFVALLVV